MKRPFRNHTPYFDFKSPRDGEDGFAYFFLNQILKSRVDLNKESNEGYSPRLTGLWENDKLLDEDVNMYLTNLLMQLASPEHQERLKLYVSEYETEVHEKAKAGDASHKFMLYKCNADYLLVASGIFGHKLGEEGAKEAAIERGKRYYGFATAYGERIYRKRTALIEALHKLRDRYGDYREILAHMTRKYLDFVQPITEPEESRLLSEIAQARGLA